MLDPPPSTLPIDMGTERPLTMCDSASPRSSSPVRFRDSSATRWLHDFGNVVGAACFQQQHSDVGILGEASALPPNRRNPIRRQRSRTARQVQARPPFRLADPRRTRPSSYVSPLAFVIVDDRSWPFIADSMCRNGIGGHSLTRRNVYHVQCVAIR